MSGETTNLANVEVAAVSIELGVVLVQHSGVGAVGRRDVFTIIVGLNDVGGSAVVVLGAKAEHVAWHEVVTGAVDHTAVHDSKLIPGVQLGLGSVSNISDTTHVETL